MKKIFLIVMTSILCSADMYSFSGFRVLKNHAGHYVYILADDHDDDLDAINTYHANQLVSWLEQHNHLFNAKNKLSCIYEFNSDHHKFKDVVSAAATIKPLLAYEERAKQTPYFSLSHEDPRSTEGLVATNLLYSIQSLLTDEEIAVYPFQFAWPRLKEKKLEKCSKLGLTMSIETYIQALETMKRQFQQLVSAQSSQPAHDLLQNIYDEYLRSMEICKKLIHGVDRNRPFCSWLYSRFDECQTFEEAKKLYHDLYSLLQKQIDNPIFDATYLHRILACQEKSRHCIIICGLNHAAALDKALTALEFKKIYFFGKDSSQIKSDTQFWPALMSQLNALIFGLENESGAVSIGSESTQNEIKTCAACLKKSAQLLRCSTCKAAWYCNQNCQKNHWSRHKENCSK